jgi:16S rRNA (uracil1498-N3)-methyltransferase
VTAPVFLGDAAEVAAAGDGDRVELTGDEGRHAADVRRLRTGEPVDVTDGAGTVLHAVVAETHRGRVVVTVRARETVPMPALRLTVVQALARGGRDELAVESMTELGVDEVVGWEASRNVAHWTDRTASKWTATVRAAAKQSRRSRWPNVSGPATTSDVVARCAAADLALVLHESATEPLAALPVPGAGEVVVVVGPEGGITDQELAELQGAGARVVRLGELVLRSSTAGAAALAVLSAATRWT